MIQTTATATGRPCAPVGLPPEITAYLARFGLTLAGFLTDSNPKLAKGSAQALPVILHHLPHKALAAAITPGYMGGSAPRSYLADLAALADREGITAKALAHNGCPWATAGCAAGCLVWAGHGGLSPKVAAARGRRTLAYLADPALYGRALLWAIARHWAKAQALGLALAARLRGTDDAPWHVIRLTVPVADAVALQRRYGLAVMPGDAITLADALREPIAAGTLALYEYSKAPTDGPLGLIAQRAAGWDVTASLAADRATAVADAWAAVAAGFRLAVPVALRKGAALPVAITITRADGAAVTLRAVDGDATDHRWQDPAGVAVILRTKASRGADRSIADPFSLRPVAGPQALADGTVALTWP
jgi:hypothetical protein